MLRALLSFVFLISFFLLSSCHFSFFKKKMSLLRVADLEGHTDRVCTQSGHIYGVQRAMCFLPAPSDSCSLPLFCAAGVVRCMVMLRQKACLVRRRQVSPVFSRIQEYDFLRHHTAFLRWSHALSLVLCFSKCTHIFSKVLIAWRRPGS